jgi:polyhydroxybutyrate depolymerase
MSAGGNDRGPRHVPGGHADKSGRVRTRLPLACANGRWASLFCWWNVIVVGILFTAACRGGEVAPSGPSRTKAPSPPVTFPSPEGAGHLEETTIDVGGRKRIYGLYVPNPAPSSAAPLVVLLHGPNSDIRSTLSDSGLAPVADERGFLIVLPQTSRKTGTAAQWAVAHDRKENNAKTDALLGLGVDSFAEVNWPFGNADANFIMAVVDAIAATRKVNEEMIFATGLQNGGLMAARMICDYPDRFAALGEVAFGPVMVKGCSQARPIAAVSVLTDGQRTYPLTLAQEHAAEWAERNGCDSQPRDRQLAPDVTEFSYHGCDADTDVVLHVVARLGYPWPWPPAVSSVDRFGNYWPAQALWEFLSSHPLS